MFNWWQSGQAGYHVGAHFQVAIDGTIYQYADTKYVLGHAWDANVWTVGIETEDDGKPSKPWSNAQLDSIVALLRELGVPGQLLKEKPSDGVGWHEQFSQWNHNGHVCPGSVREQQIRDVIIPRLNEGDITVGALEDYFGQPAAQASANMEKDNGERKALGDWKAGTAGRNRTATAGHEQDGYDYAMAQLAGVAPPK